MTALMRTFGGGLASRAVLTANIEPKTRPWPKPLLSPVTLTLWFTARPDTNTVALAGGYQDAEVTITYPDGSTSEHLAGPDGVVRVNPRDMPLNEYIRVDIRPAKPVLPLGYMRSALEHAAAATEEEMRARMHYKRP